VSSENQVQGRHRTRRHRELSGLHLHTICLARSTRVRIRHMYSVVELPQHSRTVRPLTYIITEDRTSGERIRQTILASSVPIQYRLYRSGTLELNIRRRCTIYAVEDLIQCVSRAASPDCVHRLQQPSSTPYGRVSRIHTTRLGNRV
jgi:hypothetical protein